MEGRVIKVKLTPESIGECRSGPSRLLLLAISEASPGDRVVVEGIDEIIPLNFVEDLLETESFEVENIDYDPPIYTIEALKKTSK